MKAGALPSARVAPTLLPPSTPHMPLALTPSHRPTAPTPCPPLCRVPPSINEQTGEPIPLGLPRGGRPGERPNAINSMTVQSGPLLPTGGWGGWWVGRAASCGACAAVRVLKLQSQPMSQAASSSRAGLQAVGAANPWNYFQVASPPLPPLCRDHVDGCLQLWIAPGPPRAWHAPAAGPAAKRRPPGRHVSEACGGQPCCCRAKSMDGNASRLRGADGSRPDASPTTPAAVQMWRRIRRPPGHSHPSPLLASLSHIHKRICRWTHSTYWEGDFASGMEGELRRAQAEQVGAAGHHKGLPGRGTVGRCHRQALQAVAMGRISRVKQACTYMYDGNPTYLTLPTTTATLSTTGVGQGQAE